MPEYALDPETAAELAEQLTTLRSFPRQNPVAAVAACGTMIRELCQTEDEAAAVISAALRANRWTGPGEFAALAERTLQELRRPAQATSSKTPTEQRPTCPRCPFNTGASLTPEERLAGIQHAEVDCPACPFLPTARLLAAQEEEWRAEDAAADMKIGKLGRRRREQLAEAAESRANKPETVGEIMRALLPEFAPPRRRRPKQ